MNGCTNSLDAQCWSLSDAVTQGGKISEIKQLDSTTVSAADVAMNHLDTVADELKKTIARLTERLAPVLHPVAVGIESVRDGSIYAEARGLPAPLVASIEHRVSSLSQALAALEKLEKRLAL